MGYRHFDKNDLNVSYPFSYGHSYTEFAYSDMLAVVENDSIKVIHKVTNTGNRAGKYVTQIYVAKPDSAIDRPNQELKAFAKTGLLDPGASQEFTFNVSVSELSYWDEKGSQWAVEPGDYIISAGASSRDIRSSVSVGIKK
ncbi:MAG: hypothetical protein HKO90_05655 [Flavobacteriaceae bacterium]|nr:fibronectin type III-like domain-contianing protein [Bacteroidia bacterium]NNK87747.1 hypothetical protein [Flavobacteriaceae bacterium]